MVKSKNKPLNCGLFVDWITWSATRYAGISYAMTHLHTKHTYVANIRRCRCNWRLGTTPVLLACVLQSDGVDCNCCGISIPCGTLVTRYRRVRTSDWQPGGCHWCCCLGNHQKRSDWGGECKCAARMKALWLTFRPLIKPPKSPTVRDSEWELRQHGGRRDLSTHVKPVKAASETTAVTLLFYERTDMHFL